MPLLRLFPRQVRLLELLEAGRSMRQIAEEFDARVRTVEMHVFRLMEALDVLNRADLVPAWRRYSEPDHPERVHLPEIGPLTRGAYRCPNPECEYGGKWVRGKMVPNQDRKFICVGCNAVYEPREVIDPENDEYHRYA